VLEGHGYQPCRTFVESFRAFSRCGASFISALEDRKSVPQRLKPGMAVSFYGTAEPVPFQHRVLTSALKPNSLSLLYGSTKVVP
jgi:hypothetical protein